MNTRQRMLALHRRDSAPPSAPPPAPRPRLEAVAPANPACVVGAGQRCEHPLADAELNRRLRAYEQAVRGRFAAIVPTLRQIAALQHAPDFPAQAQALAQAQLGFALPQALLDDAWVAGLDLRALHAHCIFATFQACVAGAAQDQAPWRERMPIDAGVLAACGYHTLDISPCADGRLQGLLPFVLRIAPDARVRVKAYAGALFDVERDLADWALGELAQPAAGAGAPLRCLKIAVYHYSSSHPAAQGCAAHGSDGTRALQAARQRLAELRAAAADLHAAGAAPDVLLVGLDTDIDALRLHLPDAAGLPCAERYLDTAALYRQTHALDAERARAVIAAALDAAAGGGLGDGLRRLLLALAQANLSQIEYVIHHHAGRYAVVGHDEELLCAGDAVEALPLRNLSYFAHLDTVEEGSADLDVGIRIFTGLNVRHGLPVPVLVHFAYPARVPGARERAVARALRVRDAVRARYPALAAQGLLDCRAAVSALGGAECCALVGGPEPEAAAH